MAPVKPKILLLDIETSYKVAGVWGRFNQNISMGQILQDVYVLNWSAKWLDDKYIYSDALHYDKQRYKKDPTDDRSILETVHELLNEADYVVAHNGKSFDQKVLNARFIQQGLKPPTPYLMIDTLLVARRHFKFTSNRLDDLGKTLGLGGKQSHEGFDLWVKVVRDQDRKAFDRMVIYCERDVTLLEDVYKRLRAWDTQHPNTTIGDGSTRPSCNACGSFKVKKNGIRRSRTQVYQSYQCTGCGHNMRAPVAEKQDKNSKLSKYRSV